MSPLDLLSRLGVYVERSFLPADQCRALSREMAGTAGEPGVLLQKDDRTRVDRDTKRLTQVFLSDARTTAMTAKLDGLAPRLSRHFGTELSAHEGATFYRYDEGDFYLAHRDRHDAAADAVVGHRRRVSIVLFLNAPGDGELSYAGGDLVLYDLLTDSKLSEYGLPVAAEAGLLVAFDPQLRHEVTRVTSGARCVVVSRFF